MLSRRHFVASAASSLVLVACTDANITGFSADITIDLATDTGVLNYAYLLEQVEAAFFGRVTSGFASDLTAAERVILTEMRDHELVHRDTLRAMLGASAIPVVETTFASVSFATRASVLAAARSMEDLMVAAYNGLAARVAASSTMTFAAKITSVEARHAAVIRDMLSPATTAFAGDDVVDDGLDLSITPELALASIGPYLRTTVAVEHLVA